MLERKQTFTSLRRAAVLLLALSFLTPAAQAEVVDPPAHWLAGWLLFQNAMHNHQLLHVGNDGNSQLYAEWGESYSHRFKLEPTTTTGFYKLRSLLEPTQRLAINADLRPFAGEGDDDSYLWQIETAGDLYLLRNKLYGDRRLHVGHDGNGQLYAGDNLGAANDDAYRWQIHAVEWAGDDADLTYRPSNHYMTSDLVVENRQHLGRRLGVSYVLGEQPLSDFGAISDLAFHWELQPAAQQGFYYLRNRLHPSQRLHVGHNGDQELYVGCSGDDAFQWRLEPPDQQSFYLRNKMYDTQRLRSDGGQALGALWGTDDEFKWFLRVTPSTVENFCH